MPKQTIEEHDRNNQNEPLNSLKEIEYEDECGLNEMVSQKKKKNAEEAAGVIRQCK